MTDKVKQIDELEKKLKLLNDQFLQWKEVQDLINESADLRLKIEDAYVDIQSFDIEVKMVQESVIYLNDRRDFLTEEKNESERRNEELKFQVKADNDIQAKRL